MLVRGGIVYSGNNLHGAGVFGHYWSSVSGVGSRYAYYLSLVSGGVYPSNSDYDRYYGFSVRCVALGG